MKSIFSKITFKKYSLLMIFKNTVFYYCLFILFVNFIYVYVHHKTSEQRNNKRYSTLEEQ
jgi:hypothetical protein